MKNTMERTCAVCRKKRQKESFLRIVLNKDNEVLIDYTMKKDGRGAYICKNEECFKSARKKSAFERSFKKSIDKAIYDELEKL